MLSNEVGFDQIIQALYMIKENDKKRTLEMEGRLSTLENKNDLIKKALQDLVEKL